MENGESFHAIKSQCSNRLRFEYGEGSLSLPSSSAILGLLSRVPRFSISLCNSWQLLVWKISTIDTYDHFACESIPAIVPRALLIRITFTETAEIYIWYIMVCISQSTSIRWPLSQDTGWLCLRWQIWNISASSWYRGLKHNKHVHRVSLMDFLEYILTASRLKPGILQSQWWMVFPHRCGAVSVAHAWPIQSTLTGKTLKGKGKPVLESAINACVERRLCSAIPTAYLPWKKPSTLPLFINQIDAVLKPLFFWIKKLNSSRLAANSMCPSRIGQNITRLFGQSSVF